MLKRAFLKLAALLCLAALCSAKTPRPLPPMVIHTPDTKGIDLKKYRGKAVVIVIFSTQCKECQAVLDLMGRVQNEFGPKGLQVIGAVGDTNAKFLLVPFIARFRPSFPIGYLDEPEIKKLADISKETKNAAAPILMFIDKWGMVREQYFGDSPIFRDAEKSIKSLSLAMIKVQPVAPAAPKPAAPPPQN